MIRLLFKYKAEILKEIQTEKKEISIGRGKKSDIRIEDNHVSDKHCVLRKTESGYEAEDLNTSFGTVIKGKKITTEPVSFEDDIKIGEYSVKLVKPVPDASEAFLVGIQGKMDGKKFDLIPGETRIGRSEEFNDIYISKDVDASVSRRHATITHDGKNYVLTDKRSRNRTFVNQRQVSETDEVHLKDGDEILIGKSIFRFQIGKNENYSYPRKAGIFWTRIYPKVRAAVFTLAAAAGIYLVYDGVTGIVIIDERPAEYFLTDSGWRPEGLRRFPGGYLRDGVMDITPSPAVGDITGDGSNEVIMSSPGGEVYAWTREGKLLWSKKLGQSDLTSPQLADINGNRIKDVIVGSDDSRVYVLDGRTGQLIYRSPFLGGKVLSGSAVLAGDFDGDGFSDIAAVTDDRIICFMYSPVTGSKKPYYFRTAEDILSSPVLFTGDGTQFVAVPTAGGKIYVFEAANPENRRVLDLTQSINTASGLNLILNEINSLPAVADLNNDGNEDLVSAAGSYFASALSGGRREALHWNYRIEPFSTQEPPLRYGSPVIADFSGNGLPDVALAWANGNIMALDGRSGRELWKFSLQGSRNRIIASIALADFNKDGVPDPVVAAEDGAVFIINGRGGRGEDVILARARLNAPVTATPAIADISGNGFLDVAIVSTDGSIHILNTPVRVFKNEVVWSGFRNGPENRGVLLASYDSKKAEYGMRASSGGVVVLGIFFTSALIRKIRKKKRPVKIKI